MVAETTSNSLRSAVGGKLIVTNTPFDVCVAVQASADTSADVTFADGSVVAGFPLVKGQNNIQITKAVFAAGTLVALYNR